MKANNLIYVVYNSVYNLWLVKRWKTPWARWGCIYYTTNSPAYKKGEKLTWATCRYHISWLLWIPIIIQWMSGWWYLRLLLSLMYYIMFEVRTRQNTGRLNCTCTYKGLKSRLLIFNWLPSWSRVCLGLAGTYITWLSTFFLQYLSFCWELGLWLAILTSGLANTMRNTDRTIAVRKLMIRWSSLATKYEGGF